MSHAIILFGQTERPYTTPAYAYIRKSDRLPTAGEAYEQDDPLCTVKLFTPDAAATWYIAGVDPDGLAYGVADLGLGFAEAGDFDLSEIIALRGKFGLPVERDLHWTPKRMSELVR